jgi:hypothetical protein
VLIVLPESDEAKGDIIRHHHVLGHRLLDTSGPFAELQASRTDHGQSARTM